MKRYLKNFKLTEEFVKASIYECLNRRRWTRRDTSYMFTEYYIKMNSITEYNKHILASHLRNIAYENKSELYSLVDYIADCIYKEIINRQIDLPPIRYQIRKDYSSGKLREIGISSMKQQLYDYITVNICKEMFMAKIGKYQCASIKGRGQIYGKRAIEKWFRTNPKKCRYVVKCDIKKYYPSIDQNVLKSFLNKDIDNDEVKYILFSLIDTYRQGLCIGSYLSQFLANYLLSYAYHYLDEQCFNNGQEKLIWKKLFYMDDVFMCGPYKHNVMQALSILEAYLNDILHLTIKPNWKIYCIDNQFIDMMGFKIGLKETTIRERIFKRADKLYRRYKDSKISLNEHDARALTSYYGYFKHSNSKYYLHKTKVIKTLERAKETIRNEKDNLCLK